MMWMKIKKFQKKYEDVWEGVKKEIETINSGEIKFESNDNLPLKKPIKLRLLTITLSLVFVKMLNFTLNYFR